MPDGIYPKFGETEVDEDLRILAEEQLRLRADMDRLLKQQQQLLEQREQQQKNGNSNQQDGKGSQQEKKQENGEDEKKEDGKKEDGKKDEGNKDDAKKEGGKDDEKESDQSEQKPPLRERARNWAHEHPLGVAAILASIVIVLVAGFFLWQYLQSYVNTDDAEIAGHIHQVSSRISGTVIGVYVEDTGNVAQDQKLVDLDPHDYRNALAQAQANLTQAIAALDAQAPNVPITQTTESTNAATAHLDVLNAQAALAAARQNHESALADLREAEANAANATAEEQRYRHLADKQEVSREVYDQHATAARAQAAVVASRRAVADAAAHAVEQQQSAVAEAGEREKQVQANLPRQISVQNATVATRQASVEAAKAQVAQAKLNLTYCRILAPATGIIGDKSVEVGQQVAPGQELFAITQTDDIWVTANFKETQIVRMHPSQAVTIHVDALNLDFDGYLENLPGATGAEYSLLPPENATGNYVKVVQRLPVRIRFKAGQRGFERLRPGMSVEPKVWVK